MNMNKSVVVLTTSVLMAALAATGVLAHDAAGTMQQSASEAQTGLMNPGMTGGGGGMGMHQNRTVGSGMMGHAMMSGMMGGGHMNHNHEQTHNPAFLDSPGPDNKLSTEDIRKILIGHLTAMGNKRLKVGDILQQTDGTFLADINTLDDSLVRRLRIDPKTGAMQPVTE